MGRRLDSEEKALWGRVIATVQPMHAVKAKVEQPKSPLAFRGGEGGGAAPKATRAAKQPHPNPSPKGEGLKKPPANNLDGHWDRRINKGGIVPDVSIDLHDSNLSSAYTRLDGALEQAVAQKLKVVLLVTGKPRAHDRTSGQGRGAIASVVRDWLAASRHASHISAVRTAHPRHGGTGALYIVLKK